MGNESLSDFGADWDDPYSDTDARIRAELSPDEKLLWAGRPSTRRVGCLALPISVFAVPFTLFSLTFVGMSCSMSGFFDGFPGGGFGPAGAVGVAFPLVGLFFVAIGLGMFSLPFWAMRRASKARYAVTDRRVLIWEPSFFGGGMRVRSFGPEDSGPITRVERSDGSGDLYFAQEVRHHTEGRVHHQSVGFMGIPDVRAVEQHVRRALQPGGEA